MPSQPNNIEIVILYAGTAPWVGGAEDFSWNGTMWDCHACLKNDGGNRKTTYLMGIPDQQLLSFTKQMLRIGSSLEYTFDLDGFFHGIQTYSESIDEQRSLSDAIDVFMEPWSGNSTRSELYVAYLLARSPLLAIAWADSMLPRKPVDGLRDKQYVNTTLQVEWRNVAAVMACILGGEILAVAVVLIYCRAVFI